MRLSSLLLAAVLACGACASSGSAPQPVRSAANRISRVEIDGAPTVDLLEFVRRVRPQWVVRRNPASVDVYLLQSRVGDLLELRAYRPHEMEMIEFLSPGQAEFRLPDARGRPVIVLTPRERS